MKAPVEQKALPVHFLAPEVAVDQEGRTELTELTSEIWAEMEVSMAVAAATAVVLVGVV